MLIMTVKELINKLCEMDPDSEVHMIVSAGGNDYENYIECVIPDPYIKGTVLIISPVEM